MTSASTTPGHRGRILDRNGEILATNIPVRKVVVDGSHVKNPEALAAIAAPYLGIAKANLLKELQTQSKYKVLLPDLSEDKALELQRELESKSLRGIYFHQNTVRTYPNGPLRSHVLGFLARRRLMWLSTVRSSTKTSSESRGSREAWNPTFTGSTVSVTSSGIERAAKSSFTGVRRRRLATG